MGLLEIAQHYVDCGLSCIPIRTDGSKAPDGLSLPKKPDGSYTWDPYKINRPTADELNRWFLDSDKAVAIVCGQVSGNLEVIDIESWDAARAWSEAVEAEGGRALRDRLPAVRSPRGGAHVYYRCATIAGNQKLAMELVEVLDEETGEISHKPRTLIETRGEGGYVIAPGSPAKTHETGNLYEFFKLDFTAIPEITPEEREILINAARSLNEVQVQPRYVPAKTTPEPSGRLKPGDDFNGRHSWAEILEPQGWVFLKSNGEEDYWQRPGKDGNGVSATTNYKNSDVLKVFSSNAWPFNPNDTYTKFGAYAALNFGGDCSAAARSLAKLGYGDPLPTTRYREPEILLPEPDKDNLPLIILTEIGQELDTELGNSQRIIKYFGNTLKYSAQRGWMVWNGHRWADDDFGMVRELSKRLPSLIRAEARLAPVADDNGEKVKEILYKHAKKSSTAKSVKSTLYLTETDESVAAHINQFDKDLMALNLRDCTVNLETGERWEHNPADLNTRIASAVYSEVDDCPLWKEFLRRIMPSEEMRGYLQRAVGYSLTGDVSEQVLFFCQGGGANGKSTFLDVILTMLGSYASTTPTETFAADKKSSIPNDIARLAGIRFCRVNETEEGCRLAESLIKQVTGGPLAKIPARFLHKEYFEFVPQFKVWFDGNHKPIIKGVDHGIRRRLHLIPFSVKIPEPERDKMLMIKLIAELPGILKWCMEGAEWWYKWRKQYGSGLRPPKEVTDFTDQYFEDLDTLKPFFEEECVMDGIVGASELYDAYRNYADRSGAGVMSQTRFGLQMEQRGFKRDKDSFENNRRKIYLGISLKNPKPTTYTQGKIPT